MGVGGQRHAPSNLPPRQTRYPLYRRLGGSQSWSGRVRKISPQPGFEPRTVQPVASRHTDCAKFLMGGFAILVALNIKITSIHVTSFSLVGRYQRFGGVFTTDCTVSLTRSPKNLQKLFTLYYTAASAGRIKGCICVFSLACLLINGTSARRKPVQNPLFTFWSQ
jgi:hypothetical protein